MTPSFGTKMLLKVIFEKAVFVKFKISKKFQQNIDETNPKLPKINRKIHTSLCILKNVKKKNLRTKSLETFAKCL
jgi:hypothetical protein